MTPSMVPRVGSGKLPGIYYNTGHGHLGMDLKCFYFSANIRPYFEKR